MAGVKRKRRHHDLLAWQRAIDLVAAAYAATQPFPNHELYALTSQIRRAAISVASNIAERLKYLDPESEIFARIDETFGLLGGLMKSLRTQEEP